MKTRNNSLKLLSLETGHCASCFSRFRAIDIQPNTYHLDLCMDCQATLDTLTGDNSTPMELVEAMS